MTWAFVNSKLVCGTPLKRYTQNPGFEAGVFCQSDGLLTYLLNPRTASIQRKQKVSTRLAKIQALKQNFS